MWHACRCADQGSYAAGVDERPASQTGNDHVSPVSGRRQRGRDSLGVHDIKFLRNATATCRRNY
jgi:hypothetical protein